MFWCIYPFFICRIEIDWRIGCRLNFRGIFRLWLLWRAIRIVLDRIIIWSVDLCSLVFRAIRRISCFRVSMSRRSDWICLFLSRFSGWTPLKINSLYKIWLRNEGRDESLVIYNLDTTAIPPSPLKINWFLLETKLKRIDSCQFYTCSIWVRCMHF